jgi:hypothetical protein
MAHRALNPQLVATPQAGSQNRRRGRWLPALGAAAGVVVRRRHCIPARAVLARRAAAKRVHPANDVISVRSIDAPPPITAPLSPAPPPVESLAAPAGAASTSATAKLKAQAETETAKPASDAEALKKACKAR